MPAEEHDLPHGIVATPPVAAIPPRTPSKVFSPGPAIPVGQGRVPCSDCGGQCCEWEVPFTDAAERERLGVVSLRAKPDGSCPFFLKGRCAAYADRPLECCMYPFDLVMGDGALQWVLWKSCPAYKHVDIEAALRHLEEDLLPQISNGWLEAYLTHHAAIDDKHDEAGFVPLRPVGHQFPRYRQSNREGLPRTRAHLSTSGI